MRDMTNLGEASNQLNRAEIAALRRSFSSDESVNLLHGYSSSSARTPASASLVPDHVSEFRFAVPEPVSGIDLDHPLATPPTLHRLV